MNCQNEACIYLKNGKCTLEEISIDYRGFCACCVIYDKYAAQKVEYKG